MDPNTLSMAQGKQFLRQCGIPQRDIDLMTEKWVVIASVEVLLRFPLRPGEDPTARCVSNKTHWPSRDQLCTTSERLGAQKERKSNNPSVSPTNQKPTKMKQMSAYYKHHQPQSPAQGRNPKKQQQGPGKLRVPSPEEENSRAKCKNCGAFGHVARSPRCPIKNWGKTLPLQPLGSQKEKENQEPRKPPQLQALRPLSKVERPDQRQRPEEQQRKALPQMSLEETPGSWEESVEFSALFRRPTRPLPVHTTKKRCALGPFFTGLPPVKTFDARSISTQSFNRKAGPSTWGPAEGQEVGLPLSSKPTANRPGLFSRDVPQPQPVRQRCGQDSRLKVQGPGKQSSRDAIQTYQNHPKKIRLGSHLIPQLRAPSPAVGAVQVPRPLPSTGRVRPKESPKVAAAPASRKPRVDLQPLPSSRFLSPARDTAVKRPLQASQVPGEPQGSSSKRGDKEGHGASLTMAPMSRPPEGHRAAGQSPRGFEESEGRGPCTTRSVLYEDLLVSSSSEDSGEE